MSTIAINKRKRQDEPTKKRLPKPKKFQRASSYHSSSDDNLDIEIEVPGDQLAIDEDNVSPPNFHNGTGPGEDGEGKSADLERGRNNVAKKETEDDNEENEENETDSHEDEEQDEGDEDLEDLSDESSVSESASSGTRRRRKRNDPEAFATSISTILNSKLSTAKRKDPVLSRSKDAFTASKEVAEEKLEAKARRKLREEKKAALARGRVTDVLGLNTEGVSAGDVAEKEKSLKRTAQRGVVKLFNAVRAAQVEAEKASLEMRGQGVVGMEKRQEKVNEMSKKGFLDLLVDGGR